MAVKTLMNAENIISKTVLWQLSLLDASSLAIRPINFWCSWNSERRKVRRYRLREQTVGTFDEWRRSRNTSRRPVATPAYSLLWRGFPIHLSGGIFLDAKGWSQNDTLVVVVVAISSLRVQKSPNAFLMRSGAQRNFAQILALTLPTDLPSQIFHLFSI